MFKIVRCSFYVSGKMPREGRSCLHAYHQKLDKSDLIEGGADSSSEEDAMDTKVTELIAVGASVAANCVA